MGRAISKIKHPWRDFNLESRAEKVISNPVKTAAPRHKKDALDLERMKQEYPEVFAESLRKNETLDKYLKDVYVVSNEEKPVEKALETNPSRALPQDRAQPEPYLFGHKEPDVIPPGKTTLRNALKFISQHQNEPRKYTPEHIANEHNIPEDVVKKILENYRVFQIYEPQESSKTRATFAGPAKPIVEVIREPVKSLPQPEVKKDKGDT
ncbi:protein NDUFAF4 homolog [Anthonomus grandis grandis]|uniref:protein NDUFAF4 homolog n=1 Tax=Anthonomus grandis grandis TaxID=2921223 RepID=UPI00216604FC|nr:protein NDUFAF4 homolog [Anthonomus grandis grandis]